MDGFTFGKIIFIVATVFIGSTFIFVFAMFFSPKLKGKIMSREISAFKHMMNYSKNDVKNIKENMGNISIDSEHDILMQNKNKIKEINNIYYETKKDSIKNTIKDIKGELKNSCYCKFCEKKIDTNSKYCESCGKKQ